MTSLPCVSRTIKYLHRCPPQQQQQHHLQNTTSTTTTTPPQHHLHNNNNNNNNNNTSTTPPHDVTHSWGIQNCGRTVLFPLLSRSQSWGQFGNKKYPYCRSCSREQPCYSSSSKSTPHTKLDQTSTIVQQYTEEKKPKPKEPLGAKLHPDLEKQFKVCWTDDISQDAIIEAMTPKFLTPDGLKNPSGLKSLILSLRKRVNRDV